MDASWIIVVKDQGKNYKDYDFYIATWNVLSLYRAEMLKEVAENWKNTELILQQSKR